MHLLKIKSILAYSSFCHLCLFGTFELHIAKPFRDMSFVYGNFGAYNVTKGLELTM